LSSQNKTWPNTVRNNHHCRLVELTRLADPFLNIGAGRISQRDLPRLLLLILMVTTIPFLSGCPNGNSGAKSPAITLDVTDCPKDKIKITLTADKLQKGEKWTTIVKVNVRCDDQPVKKAELKIEVEGGWWTQRYTTNDDGNLTVSGPPKDGNPGNQKITVTVRGLDGEKTQDVTIP
jgi:hypothetical protein